MDKLDYLNRDLKHTQINSAQLDYERITMNAAILENKIAYNTKILNDINIVYERRFELFKQVYLHKTCQAIEFMVSEALIAADPVYDFKSVIYDAEEYMRLLHDDLIQVIKKSRNPDLQDASRLLRRIDERDLYKCVGESVIPKDSRREIKAEDICNFQDMNLSPKGADSQLRPDDLLVHVFKIDWGSGDQYPLDNMSFFKQGVTGVPEIISLMPYETT